MSSHFYSPGNYGDKRDGCSLFVPVFLSVWFSLVLDVTQFAGVGWEREAFFSFAKPGQEYIKPLFSSAVYIYQHTQ